MAPHIEFGPFVGEFMTVRQLAASLVTFVMGKFKMAI